MPHLFRPGMPSIWSLVRSPDHNRPFDRIAVFITALWAVCCRADGLIAQESGGGAAPEPGGAGGVVVSQPFPWFGMFFTLVLVGACLFAVCRSSRRN